MIPTMISFNIITIGEAQGGEVQEGEVQGGEAQEGGEVQGGEVQGGEVQEGGQLEGPDRQGQKGEDACRGRRAGGEEAREGGVEAREGIIYIYIYTLVYDIILGATQLDPIPSNCIK